MRTFDTGATRDSDDSKLDYEGFLSPLALERYAQYMHKHRKQADGKLRDSDNWQKGIPISQYLKSKWRHFMDVWKQLRGLPGQDTLEDSLCADLFNTMGLLHEVVTQRLASEAAPAPAPLLCTDCDKHHTNNGECLARGLADPGCFRPKASVVTCAECSSTHCRYSGQVVEIADPNCFIPKVSV